MQRIGFVGAGLMGHGMACRPLAAGYPVTVVAHRNPRPIDDMVFGIAALVAEAVRHVFEKAVAEGHGERMLNELLSPGLMRIRDADPVSTE